MNGSFTTIRQLVNTRQLAREIISKSYKNRNNLKNNNNNLFPTRTKDASRVLQGFTLLLSNSLSNDSRKIPHLSSFHPSKDPFQPLPVEKIEIETKEEEWINVSEENLEMKNKIMNGKERKVPTSRMGRAWYFGTMAMGIGVGAMGESIKRSIGMSDSKYKSTIVSESNVRKLTDGLSRMRGAALKIGQMMSLQDEKLLPPELNAIIERVRNSADYMPSNQLNKMMESELGEKWKDNFQEFEMKPFAAASIGQVHKAVLGNGTKVAVKVQYPGIADSIDSDVDNLLSLLQLSGAIPKGAFIDRTIDVTKKELLVETDYYNELKNQMEYSRLLFNDADFIVPAIIPTLSTSKVITSEFMPGIPVDSVVTWDQSVRNWVSTRLIRLALRELFEFQFMQTDPNWSNFFFDAKKKKIVLLDFGACRHFEDRFVDNYIQIIWSAVQKDRELCWKASLELGFVTGKESKLMKDAHIDSAFAIGEPFTENAVYNFKNQRITSRMQDLIPIMLKNRLTAPPIEAYRQVYLTL